MFNFKCLEVSVHSKLFKFAGDTGNTVIGQWLGVRSSKQGNSLTKMGIIKH